MVDRLTVTDRLETAPSIGVSAPAAAETRNWQGPRRVAVVIDGAEDSRCAWESALKLAADHGAKLSALCVIDPATAILRQAVPAGAIGFKMRGDKRRMDEARGRMADMVAAFEAACADAGVQPEIDRFEGDCLSVLRERWTAFDLVVAGHGGRKNVPGTIRKRAMYKMIRECPRPILLATDEMRDAEERFVVAYNGSAQASRALHMFLLLGLARDRVLHIVTAHGDPARARAIAADAISICESHGHRAQAQVVKAGRTAMPAVIDKILGLRPTMLVMGAFGDTALGKMMWGSTTQMMLKRNRGPLFLVG